MKKLLALLLLLPALAFGQTASTYYTVPTITALKALTTRPSVVQTVDANPGVFNWSTTPCSAADDIFQVTPTAGPTGCYVRMGTPYAVGKSATTNGVLVTNGSGVPSISSTLPAVTSDAALVTATGSTTARSLGNRFQQQFNVQDYGNNFQLAVNAAQTAGGGLVYVPAGTYSVSSTIAISASNVGLYCPSGGLVFHNISAVPNTGCTLQWTGSSGGTILTITAPIGSTSDGALSGNSVYGINFDGNSGLAASGLTIKSVRNGRFSNLSFNYFNGGYALDLNVIHATPSNFGDPCDSQFNNFTNIAIYNSAATSVPLRLGNWSSPLIANNGCNASLNTFNGLDIQMSASNTGILLDGPDNNTFIRTRIYSAVGSGYGVDFTIHAENGLTYPANSNHFIDITSVNGIIARGQTSFPSCTSAYSNIPPSSACSWGNTVEGVDAGNNTPLPTVEPGAQLIARTTNGFTKGNVSGATALGESFVGAMQASSNVTTETLRIANGADNHVILQDYSGNSWGMNLDGAKLRFLSLSGGSSVVEIPSVTLGTPLAPAYGGTGTGTAFTPGSVVFSAGSGIYAQNNSNLFWDNSNDRLGIGTGSPTAAVHVSSGLNPSPSLTYHAPTDFSVDSPANGELVAGWGSASNFAWYLQGRNALNAAQNILLNPLGGSVGIGSEATPGAMLEVAGTVRIDGALTYGGVTFANTATGTGPLVGATSPSLVTPVLGVATATSINKVAITAPATSATLTIPDGVTLNAGPGGTLTTAAFTALGTSGATIPLLSTANTWTLGQTFSAAMTYGGVTLSNSVTGTGSMVLSDSPTFTTTMNAAAIVASGVVTTSALKTSTALITATGGSTPAFGTNFIGGTGGPTTAAQNGWLKAQDSAGATIWLPVWK